ncbi:MAG: esterase-like activity of phytase family protein [Tepidisphaeraceae bacterium]
MRLATLVTLAMFPLCAQAATLTFRDCHRIGDESVQGLSGITFGGEGRYYAVADNSNRVYPIAVDLKPDGAIAAVEVRRGWAMPARNDYEGIALSGARDSVFISDETPGIHEHLLPGLRQRRALPVPDIFKGIERNQGFESLTVSPDGATLWTANERALFVDGNPRVAATPFLAATRVRLLRYQLTPADANPNGQFEYLTSGVHGAGGQVGLCDLAALPDGRLLALERSAAKGLSGSKSIRTRIYLVDVAGATDVSKPPYDSGLVNQSPVRVSKTLLYDGFVCDADGDNLEGLCLGPALGPYRWAVIGVVDNTDGGVGVSKSAIVSFVLDLKAMPATQPATQPSAAPTSNVSGAK